MRERETTKLKQNGTQEGLRKLSTLKDCDMYSLVVLPHARKPESLKNVTQRYYLHTCGAPAKGRNNSSAPS